MTFEINLGASVSFDNYVGVSAPEIVSEARVFILPGDDEASSVVNHVSDTALPVTVIGAPSYGQGFAIIGEDIGFAGPDAASDSPFTHIIVCTEEAAGASVGLIGNWSDVDGAENMLLMKTGVAEFGLAVGGGTRVEVARIAGERFEFVVGRHDGTTARLSVGAGGVVSTTSAAFAGPTTPKGLRIGATGFGSALEGGFKVAAALSFNRSLTDAEVLEIYQYLDLLLPTRGVTVS